MRMLLCLASAALATATPFATLKQSLHAPRLLADDPYSSSIPDASASVITAAPTMNNSSTNATATPIGTIAPTQIVVPTNATAATSAPTGVVGGPTTILPTTSTVAPTIATAAPTTATVAPTTAAYVAPTTATVAPTTAAPVATTAAATAAPGLIIIDNASPVNCSELTRLANVRALNYALTLEHLEATFYSVFQAQFNRSQFDAAGFAPNTYDLFNLIAAHEAAHVTTISGAIESLGGVPVPACTYNVSSVTNVTQYVDTARLLENTGVSAYDGAINAIADESLRQVAATIATVEARHAAFLNSISSSANNNPFPNAFDTPLLPSAVLGAASAFFVSCPYTIELPAPPCCGGVVSASA